jgi:hypothetical protein
MGLLFLGEFGADDRGDVAVVSRWVNVKVTLLISPVNGKGAG